MFSFCIPTYSLHHSTDNTTRIDLIIDSIEKENIPNYEVLICGDSQNYNRKNTTIIPFDESIKPGWITKKKNILANAAKYDDLVFMHDYIVLYPGWYKGYCEFGNNWDICMNVVINKDGSRFRDWIVLDDMEEQGPRTWYHKNFENEKPFLISPWIPSYSYSKTDKLYISGSYFVVKKHVMIEEPFNESFCWGQPEDIEISLRWRKKYKIRMNTYAAVQLLHQKDVVWSARIPYFMSNEYITKDLV